MKTKDRIFDDLTRFFCLYLQATEHPPITVEDYQRQEDRSLEKYRSDPVFHAKVNTLTAHVLRIIGEGG